MKTTPAQHAQQKQTASSMSSMHSIQELKEDHQRINLLEKDVLGISFRLDNQSSVLSEIKDVLIQQNEILQNLTAIKEIVHHVREDLTELEQNFNTRKEVTDQNNKVFSDFVSKSKGVVAVTVLFFGIVQGSIGYVLVENYQDHKRFSEEISNLKIQSAVMHERQERQDRNSK